MRDSEMANSRYAMGPSREHKRRQYVDHAYDNSISFEIKFLALESIGAHPLRCPIHFAEPEFRSTEENNLRLIYVLLWRYQTVASYRFPALSFHPVYYYRTANMKSNKQLNLSNRKLDF